MKIILTLCFLITFITAYSQDYESRLAALEKQYQESLLETRAIKLNLANFQTQYMVGVGVTGLSVVAVLLGITGKQTALIAAGCVGSAVGTILIIDSHKFLNIDKRKRKG